MKYETPANRKRVNMTVREDVLAEAKTLGLNTSRAAEAGIEAAIREERSRRWLVENQAAIEAHNERIEHEGTVFTPGWAEDD